MIHKIKYKDRENVISCYLPEDSAPDKNAVAELHQMMALEETLARLKTAPGFFREDGQRIEKIILTPDFHKGAGIPIGTVMMTKGFAVPQAMGNDINCGMRFYTTDLSEKQIREKLPELTKRIRHIFFQGGRQIPMTGRQREAMFRYGLEGLLETCGDSGQNGLWKYFQKEIQEKWLNRTVFRGSLRAERTEGLEDFIGDYDRLTYDDQIGTIGGGNHFLEVQRVAEVYDGQTANAWKIKKGAVVIMLHAGSLMIGHHGGLLNRKICQDIYPAGLPHPENKIYPIPEKGGASDAWERFRSASGNAANFGFANRLFLGFMIQDALTGVLGEFGMELLYDAPHNYIWKKRIGDETYYIHRKGACCAGGCEEMGGTAFACYGEPVMIPGSMGSSSYLLRGLGNPDSLWSASHGAGRKKSRGDAMKGNDEEFRSFMEAFHIITPIDPARNDLKGRKDILKKWEESIRAEAPYAYKDINEVIAVHTAHGMAAPVARMEPVFTVKS
ncbi:MAG: RtcB family protein [Lachnospiraceae bacterium]|nr:RtcB family protein [Lachnospiraceae bacterium]MCM1238656.1 RtcB family protein [Lachnospiraceae bacterium]